MPHVVASLHRSSGRALPVLRWTLSAGPTRALIAASAVVAFLCVFALPAVASGKTTKPSPGTSTILIGSVSGTSGAWAATGGATLDGALLAVTDVNKSGGVIGKQLTLQSYDDAASSTLASALVKRLVKAGAVAILGSDDRGAVTAATADQLHVPDLGAVADTISNATALPWVWNSGPGAGAVGATDAAYTLKNCKRVALLHDTSSYGTGGAAAIKFTYVTAHRTLALDYAVSENWLTGASTSSTSQIKAIKASGAQCVLAWLTPQDTASLAQALKRNHVHVKLIGDNELAAAQTFAELAGTAANGVIAPELTAQLHPSKALASFTSAYTAKFHLAPSTGAIASYDSVLMLAAAIRREHSTTATKLRTALNTLSGSRELQGTVTFTADDHAAVSATQLTLVSYDAKTKSWKALP